METTTGLSFGHTNLCLARAPEGVEPYALADAHGRTTTPAVVSYTGEEILTGQAALNRSLVDPWRTTAFTSDLLRFGLMVYGIGDRDYATYELLGKVIAGMLADATSPPECLDRLTVAVPDYFGDVQRQIIQMAGVAAGFRWVDVLDETRCIHAAATRAPESFEHLSRKRAADDFYRTLIFDLGATGLTLTTFMAPGFRVEFTHRADAFGAHEWTRRLTEQFTRDFRASSGWDLTPHPGDPVNKWTDGGRQTLFNLAEQAKRTLSEQDLAQVNACVIDYPSTATAPAYLTRDLTRDDFEELTEDIVVRCRLTAERTLRRAGVAMDDIDQVVLAGGGANMPAIVEMLESWVGPKLVRPADPAEVAAIGAALTQPVAGRRVVLRQPTEGA